MVSVGWPLACVDLHEDVLDHRLGAAVVGGLIRRARDKAGAAELGNQVVQHIAAVLVVLEGAEVDGGGGLEHFSGRAGRASACQGV